MMVATLPQRDDPPVEPIEPRPKRFWHLDWCQNAVFAPAIRPPEDYPEIGGPGSKGFEPGFFELRSTHPIRAVEVVDSGNAEVCSIHYGKISMGIDGDARPIFGSIPYNSDPAPFIQNTALITFIRPAHDSQGNPQAEWQGIEPGFFGFLGAYHAPYWTEAVFHSNIVICGLAGT